MQIGSCGLALAVALLASTTEALQQQRSPGVQRVVYVLEVDLGRARALDWAPEGASDAQVVAGAEQVVRRRLLAMERSFDLLVDDDRHRIHCSMPQIQPRDRELFADMLKSLGSCEFLFVAESTSELDLATERKKLEDWRHANPGAPIELFHAVDPEERGPHGRLLWVETEFGAASGSTEIGEPCALLLPDRPEEHFGSASFGRSYATTDPFGLPAIGFELRESRVAEFEHLTEANLAHRMGIVIDGRLRSAPMLNAKLVGGGIIEGRFPQGTVAHMVETFQKGTGPLRLIEIR